MEQELFNPAYLQMAVTILCSGALFTFLQFLITRKDQQKKDKIDDKLGKLQKAFQEGLDQREETGKKRYNEHKIAIENGTVQHRKDFQELQKAIQQLTENDKKITESIQQICDKQDIIAESLIGQAHDRIMYLTDKIADREAITLKEKATIKSMYDPYHKLGGNGVVKENVEYIYTLPIISEEEAKEKDLNIQRSRMKRICLENKNNKG